MRAGSTSPRLILPCSTAARNAATQAGRDRSASTAAARNSGLKPGQASLHHVLLFHGSEPNRSNDRRIGLAIRYIPTHLKQAVGQKDWATLVRGKDTYGHFLPEYVPKRDLEPEALAHHKAVSEEQVRVLYRGTGKTAYRA